MQMVINLCNQEQNYWIFGGSGLALQSRLPIQVRPQIWPPAERCDLKETLSLQIIPGNICRHPKPGAVKIASRDGHKIRAAHRRYLMRIQIHDRKKYRAMTALSVLAL